MKLRVVAAGLVFALLAGCGQKGPLYLPDQDTGTVITRPTTTPQSSETAPQPSTTDPATENQRKEENSRPQPQR